MTTNDEPAVELRTERLLLRPYSLADVEDILAYCDDEEWARYLNVPAPYTRRDAEVFIARAVLSDRGTSPRFAITLDRKVVGDIILAIDVSREIAELGYSIARDHWGKGLATEAARAVIDWAFQTQALAKVFVVTDSRNRQSWRVLEKLGMKREGVLRSNRKLRGERVDDILYGLLREDWESRSEGESGSQGPA